MDLAWGSATDTGRVRAGNEDAYTAGPVVWAVADGMGGHSKGDLAAATAIDALGLDEPPERGVLLDRIRDANDAIGAIARSDGSQMGTTLCGVADTGDGSLLVFNVGDSRVYVLNVLLDPPAPLVQLSRDHSVVQELIDAGELDPALAASHPERHIVTRSLGIEDHVDIDWWTRPSVAGDRFLICSDGLCKELDDPAIASILGRGLDAQTAAEELLAAALDAGGRDNITVVVLDVLQAASRDLDDTDPRGIGFDEPTGDHPLPMAST